MVAAKQIAGVILAGGLARRMGGGDKPLLTIGGRSMIQWLVADLRPRLSALAINANGGGRGFSDLALPLLADGVAGFPGPLAGILAGLDWAATLPGVGWLLSVPGDVPFLPDDLLRRLSQAVEAGAPAAIAASGGRCHPVIGLWPVTAAAALRRNLVERDERRAMVWAEQSGAVVVEWPQSDQSDPFFNINDPGDLAIAERLAAGRSPGV